MTNEVGFSEKLDPQLSEAVGDLKTTLLMVQNQRTIPEGQLRKTTKEVLAFNELRVRMICESLIRYATSKEDCKK